MKVVTFFSPNEGISSATKLILSALNYGGPPRFERIKFVTVRGNTYSTRYKAGNESILALEVVQMPGDAGLEFVMMATVRVQSLRGSVKTRYCLQVPPMERFPAIDKKWKKEMCEHLKYGKEEDLWFHLLDVERLRKTPL